MLHVGDSLAYGTSLYLRQYLKGWRVQDDVDVSMQSYAVPKEVAAYGAALPRVLIVSAGTNGHPAATAQFKADVRRVLALAGPEAVRDLGEHRAPAVPGGQLHEAQPGARRARPRRMPTSSSSTGRGMVARHPGALSSDGVHVAVPFYRERARALAAPGEALRLTSHVDPAPATNRRRPDRGLERRGRRRRAATRRRSPSGAATRRAEIALPGAAGRRRRPAIDAAARQVTRS